MSERIRISDHAVLCYLERVDGVDVDAVRRKLARLAKTASDCALPGANGVQFDGFRIVIKDNTAVTVSATHPDKRAKRKSG